MWKPPALSKNELKRSHSISDCTDKANRPTSSSNFRKSSTGCMALNSPLTQDRSLSNDFPSVSRLHSASMPNSPFTKDSVLTSDSSFEDDVLVDTLSDLSMIDDSYVSLKEVVLTDDAEEKVEKCYYV